MLDKLPSQWQSEHGYRPLLAESFSDPESHHGTVYKATNWTCAGETKGFSQDHTDYYLPNERPKKLWLKPLDPQAYVLMSAPHLPADCQAALTTGGGARSPLKTAGRPPPPHQSGPKPRPHPQCPVGHHPIR